MPLYPEGDPTSMASQEILYWQNLTMEAMYRRIALEIQVAVSVQEVYRENQVEVHLNTKIVLEIQVSVPVKEGSTGAAGRGF